MQCLPRLPEPDRVHTQLRSAIDRDVFDLRSMRLWLALKLHQVVRKRADKTQSLARDRMRECEQGCV